MIQAKKLPHGKVPLVAIKDRSTRDAVMKLNENIVSLSEQLAELQSEHLSVRRDLNGALTKIATLGSLT